MLFLRVLNKVKNTVKYILQRILGFRRYLYVFSLFKIKTLRKDKNEKDFFHFLSLMKDGRGDVLDIGANIGVMTWHLAKTLPNATVHAVEPVPFNADTLQKIVDRFALKNVRIHRVAVGEQQGVLKMILPHNGKTRMHGLTHVKHESITEWNEGEEFEVPVDTLDHLIPATDIQGIKMDIENFEYFALKGGEQLIERCHPVIYTELWDNDNRKACFDFLASKGYSCYVVAAGELVPYNPAVHDAQNFIFRKTTNPSAVEFEG